MTQSTNSPLPTLDAGRFQLRAWRNDDLALVEEASMDDLIPLITTVPTPFTEAEGYAFIERQHQRVVDGDGSPFVIHDLEEDRGIGAIGLWPITKDAARTSIAHWSGGRASIGYWVAKSGRRRGAASAALVALADWASTRLEIARLELYVEPWNDASVRTAELAGFEREGLLRSWQLVGDQRRDMYMYSRIR